MGRQDARREKGTGTIEKKNRHFYLKIRVGKVTKTTLLLGPDEQPVTTRVAAEKAAALLRPMLLADQKKELAFYVAEAKNMLQGRSMPPDMVWPLFLKQHTRPDSSTKTLELYQTAWRSFMNWMHRCCPADQSTAQITPELMQDYFFALWQDNVSARTYNAYRQAIRLIFKHTHKLIGQDANPAADITSKPGETISRNEFSCEQVNAIFSGFRNGFFYQSRQVGFGPGRTRVCRMITREFIPQYKDEMFVLLNLCCWTGCRGQDGCLMQWRNIDLPHNRITYIPRKTAKKTARRSVTQPIHPELLQALMQAKAWQQDNGKKEDYIIPHVAHRFLQNHSGIQKDVMKIIHCALGVETTGEIVETHRKKRPNEYSLHSFRHTFVSFCANAGVPQDIVASIVGHGSSAMTRHYAHISDEAKQKAVDALPVFRSSIAADNKRTALLKQIASMPTEELVKMLEVLQV